METKGGGEYFQQEPETVQWLVSFETLELILYWEAGLVIDIQEHSHVVHSGREKKSYYVSLDMMFNVLEGVECSNCQKVICSNNKKPTTELLKQL